jgi:putative FmdB family regulatory protein
VPIYEYRCDDCEALYEVMQKMSDDPLEVCEACGGHLRKVLHPVAIHFKGSGFYTTDYGRGSKGQPAKDPAEAGPATSSDVKPATRPADSSSDVSPGKAAKAGSPASS